MRERAIVVKRLRAAQQIMRFTAEIGKLMVD
jgi:hypothetical protein